MLGNMKKYIGALLCCSSMITPLLAKSWHFEQKDVLSLHRTPATKQILYGKSPLLFGLLRLPETPGPHPVVVLVHGGCWLASMATVQMTEPLADALRDAGYATWNIEYRSVDVSGGGFPGTFSDVGLGLDYLRVLAPQYHLDLSRVVLVGHSAGGHLALWAADRPQLPKQSVLHVSNPLPVRGVISLGGVPDLKLTRQQGIQICGKDVIGRLLGASDGQPIKEERYRETSPMQMDPSSVLQVLMYGADDQVVPAVVAQQYVKTQARKGGVVRLKIIPYSAHQEYVVPNSVVWPTLLETIREMTHVS